MELPTTNYKLNTKQIHILKLIHKFRYINAPLLAKYKSLNSRQAMHTTLERLVGQGYLDKRTDNNLLFQNKGARYYLTPKAFKLLREQHEYSDRTLNLIYKNKTVQEDFVDQYIDTLRVYLTLRETYPDTFHIFSRTELMEYEGFPIDKPNLYLNRIKSSQTKTNEFMLYVLSATTQFFILKKQFNRILEHFDSGEWEADCETPYPAILFVCPDSRIETKLIKHAERTLENAGIDDLLIYTTTINKLNKLTSSNTAPWKNMLRQEETFSI